jgi:Ca-activated chloride channel homolog
MIRVVVVAAVLFGQGQTLPGTFRSGVEVVRVNVLATDGNRPVSGLTAADFEVRDNGVLQTIDLVETANMPISMTLMLDTSQSVKGETLDRLKKAAIGALTQLSPADRVTLLTFNSAVSRRVDWTNSRELAAEAIEAAEATAGTALYDAACAALIANDSQPGTRQLVLVFSDGIDTASWLPAAAAIELARRSEMVVYSVVLGRSNQFRDSLLFRRSGVETLDRFVPPHALRPFLEELSKTTGGSNYIAESSAALQRQFARIVNEFRTRYVITYTPRGVDRSGWHPIEVKLKGRNGRITARRGYMR